MGSLDAPTGPAPSLDFPSAKGRIDAETKTGHAEVKTPKGATALRLAKFFDVFGLKVNTFSDAGEYTVRAEGPEKNITAAMKTYMSYGDIIMGDE